MLHVNEEIKKHFYKSPSLYKMHQLLIASIFPEMYLATTIDDFVENEKDIKLTRKILPPAIRYCEKAWIFFNSVEYKRVDKDWCELSDLSSTIEAKILLPDKAIANLSNGSILESALVVYSPKSKESLLWFTNYSIFETQVPDRSKALIPAFSSI